MILFEVKNRWQSKVNKLGRRMIGVPPEKGDY
jgi:hypothetical protein